MLPVDHQRRAPTVLSGFSPVPSEASLTCSCTCSPLNCDANGHAGNTADTNASSFLQGDVSGYKTWRLFVNFKVLSTWGFKKTSYATVDLWKYFKWNILNKQKWMWNRFLGDDDVVFTGQYSRAVFFSFTIIMRLIKLHRTNRGPGRRTLHPSVDQLTDERREAGTQGIRRDGND